MRIARIEGDHARYHAGGAAVMQGLRRVLSENDWIPTGRDQQYDILVMNGEGSMHHGSGAFHKKMKQLAKAMADGKPAFLVNSVWQDNPSEYDDVLRALSGITVREIYSQRDLFDRHGIEASVIPDLSMYAPLPRYCWWTNFRGRPAITDFHFKDGSGFHRDDTIDPSARFLRFKQISWGNAVKSLQTASYLVTGRQHGVYAACKARIPFAASGGNTHKTEALIASAGANIPIARDPSGIRDLIPLLPRLGDEFQKLFDWLEAQDYRSIIPKAPRPSRT